MRRSRVDLGQRSYDILVGAGLLNCLAEQLEGMGDWQKAAIITDSNVGPLFAELVTKQLQTLVSASVLVVEAGEKSKSWDVAGRLLEDLARLGLERRDLVVTLGGGVVSDLGGFIASAYLRGVRVIHIPTTLLGQVDAAVGGKTGVNLSAGKNLAGAFYQPSAVFCDVETLLSLPDEEFRSGLAEVIKYGLCFDPAILDILRDRFGGRGGGSAKKPAQGPADPLVLEDLVHRCAGIKAEVVSGDEKDGGRRLLLNYGHTFGHALEAAGGYEKWSHGEAISVGMMFAASLAIHKGLIDRRAFELHAEMLTAFGLPLKAEFDPEQVASLWKMDKKRQGRQRWVLLEGIGRPVVHSDVGSPELGAAVKAVLA